MQTDQVIIERILVILKKLKENLYLSTDAKNRKFAPKVTEARKKIANLRTS